MKRCILDGLCNFNISHITSLLLISRHYKHKLTSKSDEGNDPVKVDRKSQSLTLRSHFASAVKRKENFDSTGSKEYLVTKPTSSYTIFTISVTQV